MKTTVAKQSVMRPQDVLVLLKKMTPSGHLMNGKELAASIGISQSEVSEAMTRNAAACLVDFSKKKINCLSFREFLIYGVKYCFPAMLGPVVRGVPTMVSASPIKERISSGDASYVWKDSRGTLRGQSVTPLVHTVPQVALADEDLHRLLAIVDTLRIGRARERQIAIEELDKYFDAYGEEQC